MYCSQCGAQSPDDSKFCPNCGKNLAPLAASVAHVEYAGFWRRFLAYMVDRLILGIPLGIIVLIFVVPSIVALVHKSGDSDIGPFVVLSFIAGWVWLIVLYLAAYILYFAWFESSRHQATPGKMLLGIVVTDLEGRPVSFLRSLGRNAGKLISHLAFHIGFIMAGLTPRKQALHDMLADCLVVMKPLT